MKARRWWSETTGITDASTETQVVGNAGAEHEALTITEMGGAAGLIGNVAERIEQALNHYAPDGTSIARAYDAIGAVERDGYAMARIPWERLRAVSNIAARAAKAHDIDAVHSADRAVREGRWRHAVSELARITQSEQKFTVRVSETTEGGEIVHRVDIAARDGKDTAQIIVAGGAHEHPHDLERTQREIANTVHELSTQCASATHVALALGARPTSTQFTITDARRGTLECERAKRENDDPRDVRSRTGRPGFAAAVNEVTPTSVELLVGQPPGEKHADAVAVSVHRASEETAAEQIARTLESALDTIAGDGPEISAQAALLDIGAQDDGAPSRMAAKLLSTVIGIAHVAREPSAPARSHIGRMRRTHIDEAIDALVARQWERAEKAWHQAERVLRGPRRARPREFVVATLAHPSGAVRIATHECLCDGERCEGVSIASAERTGEHSLPKTAAQAIADTFGVEVLELRPIATRPWGYARDNVVTAYVATRWTNTVRTGRWADPIRLTGMNDACTRTGADLIRAHIEGPQRGTGNANRAHAEDVDSEMKRCDVHDVRVQIGFEYQKGWEAISVSILDRDPMAEPDTDALRWRAIGDGAEDKLGELARNGATEIAARMLAGGDEQRSWYTRGWVAFARAQPLGPEHAGSPTIHLEVAGPVT